MSFWIAVAALSAMTLYFLSRPIRQKTAEEAERADYDLTIFKDQLKELERDHERGLISQEETETARLEIQRRLLAADQARHGAAQATGKVGVATLIISAISGIGVIVGALAIYLTLGSPGYPDMPFAERDLEKERQLAASGQAGNIEEEIANLQKHLEENPTDVTGWVVLARTFRRLERAEESVAAFASAVKASDGHPSLIADYAEARIFAADGAVDEDTFALLQDSLRQDPTQMKARFYLGFAQARGEDYKGAVQTWTDVLALAPKDAPWMAQIQEQINKAAEAGGFDPATVTASPEIRVLAKQLSLQAPQQTANAQPGPTAEQMRDAQEMSPEEREDMIRSMVQRLADRVEENPDDLEGWKRLVQVYGVLGEVDKQAQARAMVEKLTN